LTLVPKFNLRKSGSGILAAGLSGATRQFLVTANIDIPAYQS
jgi:hypothetical protein